MNKLVATLILPIAALALPTLAADTEARLVSIAQVENRPLSPKIMVIGSVHSRNNAELTTGVSGRLDWVQEAGTRVQAGDTVARLDKTRLELEHTEQQALIRREQINLTQLQRNFERLQKLSRSQSVSRNELDDASTALELAKSNLELARIKLDIIQDNINRTELKAPFAGIITNRLHQAGEDIGPAEAVVSLTDPEHLEIRLHAPLKHSRRVKVGDSLNIYHADGEFQASIRSLIPVSDVRSQTFEARLDLPGALDGSISVGELVSLALPIAPAQLTTLVPRDAIVLRSSGAFIFRINGDNKAERLAVTLGDGAGDWIAVQGQLQAGDRVVIRGAETLQDGQLVRFAPEQQQLAKGTS
ncbi:efflux RND transporter periplasmic adaptor subunit [Shewanella cyperi]|uniref:efflux RND transporter periplasmic adaptor subunit n=1 Tax=Shewanella cyperi TaxID=2814292 RepID=UPI001A944F01|nr:efflux RND transporter periplasmic adaptor subunit [Shewanella cyperi]QSX40988.1 efflux RND transporter periplasmic adaptor subunit [Shewanella cyperi]